MRSLPPLDALRAFESAALLGGFKAASEALHVTPAAISHQVKQLESHLGLTVFERHPTFPDFRSGDSGTPSPQILVMMHLWCTC